MAIKREGDTGTIYFREFKFLCEDNQYYFIADDGKYIDLGCEIFCNEEICIFMSNKFYLRIFHSTAFLEFLHPFQSFSIDVYKKEVLIKTHFVTNSLRY